MWCPEENTVQTELPLSLVTARRLYRPQLDCTPPQPRGTHISCLYPEILAHIFGYLSVRDKGRAAQVCISWHEASCQKSVWRGVEAKLHLRRSTPGLFSSLRRRGIRRVQVLSFRRTLRDVVHGIDNLESLNVSGCYNITDVGLSHAFVHEMPTLTELDLSLCKQVTDSGVGRIAQCLKNLESLNLAGCCNISTSGLLLISWGLKKLKRLDLRSCWHVSDAGIRLLAGIPEGGNPELEYLGLQDCQRLSDEALKHISIGCTRLERINLSFCVNITDSGLKYLAKMPSLRELNLRACDNVSDVGMAYLADGGAPLSLLDISFCEKMSDQALGFISHGLYHLRTLSISNCNIGDEGLIKIAKTLYELETLHMGQCSRITDNSLYIIADSLKNLKTIDLYGCIKITAVGLERILKLPKLQDLNTGL